HNERQVSLRALRNREGILNLILDAIDKITLITQQGYLVLSRGKRLARTGISFQFANSHRLNWLSAWGLLGEGTGMLDVLHCASMDSRGPQRYEGGTTSRSSSLCWRSTGDPKGMCCVPCVGNGTAVRLSAEQHLARPNIFVGFVEGSAIYQKWYFEVTLDPSSRRHTFPHLRLGLGQYQGLRQLPWRRREWGGNGVGDDLSPSAGSFLWTGGRYTLANPIDSLPLIKKGDVIGCALDCAHHHLLCEWPSGERRFQASTWTACSSCGIGLCQAQTLTIDPCFYFGDQHKGTLASPLDPRRPRVCAQTVDTSAIQLAAYIEQVRDKLAENIHEMWAMNKIEQGWTYSERRDDLRHHPCLTSFELHPAKSDTTPPSPSRPSRPCCPANLTMDKPPSRIRSVRLPNDPFLQSNGYKPQPSDLSQISLVQAGGVRWTLANTHNIWARERIMGVTYGLMRNLTCAAHLVSYGNVDEAIKKANRDTASETIRTLLVYRYILEAPPATNDGAANMDHRDTGAGNMGFGDTGVGKMGNGGTGGKMGHGDTGAGNMGHGGHGCWKHGSWGHRWETWFIETQVLEAWVMETDAGNMGHGGTGAGNMVHGETAAAAAQVRPQRGTPHRTYRLEDQRRHLGQVVLEMESHLRSHAWGG
ncbi:Ryanodine receptor-like 4, partial [Homarus americanus]